MTERERLSESRDGLKRRLHEVVDADQDFTDRHDRMKAFIDEIVDDECHDAIEAADDDTERTRAHPPFCWCARCHFLGSNAEHHRAWRDNQGV